MAPQRRLQAAPSAPLNAVLGEQLRSAIRARDLTAYALAKASGVDSRLIARFLAGEKAMTVGSAERPGTADKLAAVLGLRLNETARKPTTRPTAARPQPLPPLLEAEDLADDVS